LRSSLSGMQFIDYQVPLMVSPLPPGSFFHFPPEVVVAYSSNLLTLGHKSSSFSQLFVSTEASDAALKLCVIFCFIIIMKSVKI